MKKNVKTGSNFVFFMYRALENFASLKNQLYIFSIWKPIKFPTSPKSLINVFTVSYLVQFNQRMHGNVLLWWNPRCNMTYDISHSALYKGNKDMCLTSFLRTYEPDTESHILTTCFWYKNSWLPRNLFYWIINAILQNNYTLWSRPSWGNPPFGFWLNYHLLCSSVMDTDT